MEGKKEKGVGEGGREEGRLREAGKKGGGAGT